MSADDPDTTAWKAFAASHTADEIFDADIPAPAAVVSGTREAHDALQGLITWAGATREGLVGHSDERLAFDRELETAKKVREKLYAALSAPVPPADGAPDYEAAAIALGFVKLSTGNWAHPNDGQHYDMTRFYRSAEEIFNRELLGLLIPSGAGAAEPVAWTPFRFVQVAFAQFKEPELRKIVDAISKQFALPPVRGDREAIARIFDRGAFEEHYCSMYPDRSTIEQYEAFKKADAILSLPVQSSAPVELLGAFERLQRRLKNYCDSANAGHMPSDAREFARRIALGFASAYEEAGYPAPKIEPMSDAEYMASLSSAPEATVSARLIPAGIYFDVNGANFYSVERGRGCGQQFYNEWRSRAAEFPQSKEAALTLMPEWLDMKSAPQNATEIVLRIPAPGWPGHYAQIGHFAEMDGSEQPPCKGWFRNTGHGFVELEEPTGWRWVSMVAPSSPQDVGREATIEEHHKLDNDRQVFFSEQDFYVLSNFSAFSLVWEGIRFDTSEAAYHYIKFIPFNDTDAHRDVRAAIQQAPSAHEAFKIAERNKPLRRPDWDEVKTVVMRDILRAKAEQHEYVRRKLLATGDRELIEDSWRDDFWGWGPKRDGQNALGNLWMEIRTELRSLSRKGGPP